MSRSPSSAALVVAGCLAASFASIALAAEPAVPPGVVRLASSASVEVGKDLLTVSFTTTREGADAAAVQSQLKQALDAALNEARKAARPGQVDVQTGAFSVAPRYTSKGAVSGWQGSAELVVDGRDMQAIGLLSGRITTLSIGRVGYGLSRELREKSEAEVSGRAIAAYRAKADSYAKQFGYASYVVREVEVTASEPMLARPMMAMQKSMSSASDDALPIEAGKTMVTVNVNGTVQLLK